VSFGVTPRLILEYTSSKKEYWLVDGWDGYDPYRSKVIKTRTVHNQYCSNINDVKEIFSGYDNVRIIQGFAPEALHSIEAEKISFLHLDTTDQECEAASIEFLWDRIVPGGIVIIDMFNLGRGYVEEYAPLFKKLGCSDSVIGTSHGQGIIVKR
jgi:precorrin-6B methylase 2